MSCLQTLLSFLPPRWVALVYLVLVVPLRVYTMDAHTHCFQKSVVSLDPRRKDGSSVSFSLNLQLDKSYVSVQAMPVSPE